MDAKIKEYLEMERDRKAAERKKKILEEEVYRQLQLVCNIEYAMENLEKEIIAEMESDGCLTADYDEGAPKLTRIALVTRRQSPKPQSPDAVPDDYIVVKEVKNINQAKIKADFMDAAILPNWLKRDEPVKSLQIRYVNK